MSLIVLAKVDGEGFVFSDGAVSTWEPRLLRDDVKKFVALKNVIVAAGGDAECAGALLDKARELPEDTGFDDAAAFLRSEIIAHNRTYGVRRAGVRDAYNLGVGLLGRDEGLTKMLVWDVHTGVEKMLDLAVDGFIFSLRDEATEFCNKFIPPALGRYRARRDFGRLRAEMEDIFKAVSKQYPEQIGGPLFWARLGHAERAAWALDANSRLAGTFYNNPVNSNPTSNIFPLSQSGTSKTINIASFTLTFGFGTRTYNSGTVSVASYAVQYYVYFSDPTFNGGAVTYYATTTATDLTAGEGHIYIGYITLNSGGGGSGGGGLHCPADDQLLETKAGHIPARQVVKGTCLRGADGRWKLVARAESVAGPLVYLAIGGETYHVDTDHRWLKPGGNPATGELETDWISTADLRVGDFVQGADGRLYPVEEIGKPHDGFFREITLEPDGDRSFRIGKTIAHNMVTT